MESDLPSKVAERKMPATTRMTRMQKIVSQYPPVHRLR